MENVTKTPYAEWLEEMIRGIMEHKPVRMCACMVLESGEVYTNYYGACSPQDIAVMAYHINTDSIWILLRNNAAELLRAAEEEDDAE